MKTVQRILAGVIAGVAGWVVWTKVQQEREEREIWAEVTDSFGETPGSELPYTPKSG
ncbi:MAG TPA: DLW-39 family protein [Actinomycetaceae bacterium]|nr:DLW-39 family protein [Actinomycetaceae bacterium]